jgi:alkylhydroperoxidase/carboxymuconolactone decarboxylase family protein YurZ
VIERFAAEMKVAFAPGKLDPLTKELVYLAVSIANQCDYCIASHGAMAR